MGLCHACSLNKMKPDRCSHGRQSCRSPRPRRIRKAVRVFLLKEQIYSRQVHSFRALLWQVLAIFFRQNCVLTVIFLRYTLRANFYLTLRKCPCFYGRHRRRAEMADPRTHLACSLFPIPDLQINHKSVLESKIDFEKKKKTPPSLACDSGVRQRVPHACAKRCVTRKSIIA